MISNPALVFSEAAKIINNSLDRNGVTHKSFSKDDFAKSSTLLDSNLIELTDQSVDPAVTKWNSVCPNRWGDTTSNFYHFKSVKFTLDILNNRSIQVSNLLSNDDNDYAEYEEYFRRYGPLYQLIPSSYDPNKRNSALLPRDRPIDDERDDIMILCFTENHLGKSDPECFWKGDYGGDDTKVCIIFKYLSFNSDCRHLFDFRDVAYDTGYQFDFINDINYHLGKKVGVQLYSPGLTKFGKFYKRGKFSTEDETRLAFHPRALKANCSLQFTKVFKVCSVGNRTYFELPLHGNMTTPNDWFDLTIQEVLVGTKVSKADFESIDIALSKNFGVHAKYRDK